MKNTELFYLAMAALGGYAAWLTIKKQRNAQASADWLTAGAFSGNSLGFYGNKKPFDNMNYLVNIDNQQPKSIFKLLGLS